MVMKRDLLKQIRNEWRENIWLVLELFIVLLALWYFCMQFYSDYMRYSISPGVDTSDVYEMDFMMISPQSKDFIDFKEETPEKNLEDMVTLLQRLRANPNVEAAGFSSNGTPYTRSFQGRHISVDDGDSVTLYVNRMYLSPEMIDVYRLESTNGFTREEMKTALEKGEILLGSNPEFDSQRDVRKYLGRPLYGLVTDSTKRIIANILIKPIRQSRFDRPDYGTAIIAIDEAEVASGRSERPWSILVRLKPGCKEAFLEGLLKEPSLSRGRTMYLTEPLSLELHREAIHRSDMISLRLKAGGSVCLLLMVFLGLTGTFWYRVRNRENEIAIRKVNGATSGDIFQRLISEGILLLGIASIIGVACVWSVYRLSILPHFAAADVVAGGIFSFLFILLIIVTSIAIPAKMAMNVKPAEALKSE